MKQRSWEYMAWAGLLSLALVAGLALGWSVAPQPVVGLIRYEAAIDLTTAGQLVNLLEMARQDDRLAAVVLEITSPGGLATSSESIFYSMLKLREQKPIVVVIDGLAVSGGYYVAAAANRIYAPASSYVGNVGTRGPRPGDPSLAAEELSSGPYKLTGGSRFDRIRQMDLVKHAFVENIVHQRLNADNPLLMDAETVAEARIYLGSEAVAVGLIDYEGGRSDAILGAAQLAQLDSYQVQDLADYFGLGYSTIWPDFRVAVKSMVETAPPEAIFLLDSRLPLPGLLESSEIEQHMLKLREIRPASLHSLESRTDVNAAAAEVPAAAEKDVQ